jgi:uncharacterized protein (TIGR02285 family)
MQGCMRLFIPLLLCWSASSVGEVLPWALLPLPGVVDVVDGEPQGGLQVEALKLLQQQMQDVSATYRSVGRRRQLLEMSEGVDFCSAPFFLDAEGQKVGYFVPFILSTPIQAVLRADQLHRFALVGGRLPLEETLGNPALRGAVAAGRTYPTEIQGLLTQATASGRLQTVGGSAGGENLLLMIAAGRIDYGFEFASIARQMNERPQVRGALVGVPLLEYHRLVQSGIYCTRSAWGKRMALRLDAAVRQLTADPENLLPLYRRWVPKETYQAYAHELARAYRQRSRQTLQLD